MSNRPRDSSLSAKFCIVSQTVSIRLLHSEAAMFSAACEQLGPSHSTATIEHVGCRCAIMRAMRPVPVPMSSANSSCGRTLHHAPSNVPSVPTFMAHRCWFTVNLLNLNTELPISLYFRYPSIPAPKSEKSYFTGSSASNALSNAVICSTAFQSLCFLVSSPNARPMLPL